MIANDFILFQGVVRGIEVAEQLEDIGFGMSLESKSFQKLCKLVFRGKVEFVVVENRDRLVKFGFEMIQQFFLYFKCKITALNDAIENRSYEQELANDIISQ